MISLSFYRFTKFGGPVPYRPAEDMAFSVARFIQKGGSFINYYMVKLKLLSSFFFNHVHKVNQTPVLSFSISHAQYHGGTNFGRTAGGPFIATSYDYDAPLDEYGKLAQSKFQYFYLLKITIVVILIIIVNCLQTGLERQPKWGHLKDLHRAIKLCEPALLSGEPTRMPLGNYQEVSTQSLFHFWLLLLVFLWSTC